MRAYRIGYRGGAERLVIAETIHGALNFGVKYGDVVVVEWLQQWGVDVGIVDTTDEPISLGWNNDFADDDYTQKVYYGTRDDVKPLGDINVLEELKRKLDSGIY